MIQINRHRNFTNQELEFIKSNYQHLYCKEIAIKLHCSIYSIYNVAHRLNLQKGTYPWNRGFAGKGICKKNRASFIKGIIPWNTGTKGICKANNGSFKKGIIPYNTGHDGDIRIRKNKKRKPYKFYRVSKMHWIHYHRKIWMDTYGPIPAGYIIVFKNNDQMDVRIENLEMITREENMRRNTIQKYPEELRVTMQTLGRLKHLINEKN